MPIICNQENFILRKNAFTVKNALSGFHVLFQGAKKDNLDNDRPANGMFIALPVDYTSCIFEVSPSHWRVQAAILKTDNADILLINSYFPTDNGNIQAHNDELEEVFYAIEEVIAMCSQA